ncbi:MAG TPA: hypothetical protein VFF16_11455 [Telluria sp.]|nr:hypothetical protein [Telluria sp.]
MERTSDLHQRSARPDLLGAHRAAQEPASRILGRLERRGAALDPRWLATGLAVAGFLLLLLIWLAWTNAHTVHPLPKAPPQPLAQLEPVSKKPLVVFESPGGASSVAESSPIPAVLAVARAGVGWTAPAAATPASPRPAPPPPRARRARAPAPPAAPAAPASAEADPDVDLITALRKAASSPPE